ncbi:MAG: amidohydrolase family protein [Polyangiales bacterium]
MSELDTVIRGGTVLTLCPVHDTREVRADLRVRGARIIAMGRAARRGPPARVLPAEGCVVIPGFVQAHVHLCQTLFRGTADGLPLLPWLQRRIWPFEAAHDARSTRASAQLGAAELLRSGTTTVLDMGSVHHHEHVFEALLASGLRAFSGKAMMDRGRGVPAGLRETLRDSLRASDALRDAWHGAADGRLRYAYAPRFVLSCSEALLRGVSERATTSAPSMPTLMHTHAAEHAEERAEVRRRLGRDDIDALAAHGITGPRALLAHGVQLRPAEIKRLARAGTRVVHCPSANMKLGSGIAPLRAFREHGLAVALGADGAPCNNRLDVFTEMRQAALLSCARERDALATSAAHALRLATIDGARALGLDGDVGTLEIGKRADITVVHISALHHEPGGDALSRLVYATQASDVRHVMVDGRVLVERGELRSLDEATVLTDARRELRKLMSRAS